MTKQYIVLLGLKINEDPKNWIVGATYIHMPPTEHIRIQRNARNVTKHQEFWETLEPNTYPTAYKKFQLQISWKSMVRMVGGLGYDITHNIARCKLALIFDFLSFSRSYAFYFRDFTLARFTRLEDKIKESVHSRTQRVK